MTPTQAACHFPTVPLSGNATARVAPELRCARARSTVAAVDMIHDLAAPVLPNPGRGMNVVGGVNVTQSWLLSPVRSQLGPKVDPVLYTSCARRRRPSHSPYAHSVETPAIPATIGENCHGATRTSGEADRAAQAAGDLPPGSARAKPMVASPPLVRPSLVFTVPFADCRYVCPDCAAPVDLELFANRSWRYVHSDTGATGCERTAPTG
jgi:hypothetical protein